MFLRKYAISVYYVVYIGIYMKQNYLKVIIEKLHFMNVVSNLYCKYLKQVFVLIKALRVLSNNAANFYSTMQVSYQYYKILLNHLLTTSKM